MKNILTIGIDPGNQQSAVVAIQGADVTHHGIYLNGAELFDGIELAFRSAKRSDAEKLCAVEMIASYGMPVGETVFETCVWVGRIVERIRQVRREVPRKVYRKDVKMHLCQSMRAKDANIRQAILDLYPPIGGGKTPQQGTKAEPGPLYGIAKDEWAALGVALTAREKWHEMKVFT